MFGCGGAALGYAWFIPFWTLMIEICLGFGELGLELEI
jgi:hypothetical protein